MTFPSRSGIAAGQSPVRCGDSGTVPLLREESEMNGGALRVLAEVEFEAFAFAQVGAGCFALPAELGQGIVVEGDDRLRRDGAPRESRSEEHTSELQSLMRYSYAGFCLKKTKTRQISTRLLYHHTTDHT